MLVLMIAVYISIHALLAESDKLHYILGRIYAHFYPRSPCGERRYAVGLGEREKKISIHALLAESDAAPVLAHGNGQNFYPRSPCGERQHGRQRKHGSYYYFYPRSPCGERHGSYHGGIDTVHISIHALLAESDHFHGSSFRLPKPFLSTLSLRRATGLPARRQISEVISIHALLAESDVSPAAAPSRLSTFLSTLSLRRATAVLSGF